MIVPCIDIMGGKVVQLVQGREPALEGGSVEAMLRLFAGFPEIQVIDLDAATGDGANNEMVEAISKRVTARVGGGVRSPKRALELAACGAYRIIVGTSAFTNNGPNTVLLQRLAEAVGANRLVIALDSKDGYIVVRGWRESTSLRALDIIGELDAYCGGYLCTYVDKEGMMEGTDINWFSRLRESTTREITAAGGITTMDDVRALSAMNIHCAVGMAIYTGRLNIDELAEFNTRLAQSF